MEEVFSVNSSPCSDLRIEREWRERLQETSVRDREGLEVAKREVDFLR